MNKHILIIIFQFIFNFALSQIIENDTILLWQDHKPLEWNDFKGVKDASVIIQDSLVEIKALSSIKIDFIQIQVDNFEFPFPVCYFVKNNSWSISSSSHLLRHEQIHFNIFEVFTRKIRKKYLELVKMDKIESNQFQIVFDALSKELIEVNSLYDKETRHSFIKSKQIEWDLKIKNELENLKEFEYIPE